MRWIVLVGGAVGLVAAVQLFGGRAPAPARPASVGDVREQSALPVVAAAPAWTTPDDGQHRFAPPSRPPEHADRETEPVAPPPVSKADMISRMETTFTSQRIDASWARDSVRSLRAALESNASSGSGVRDIECRESLCRVETWHSEPVEFLKFGEAHFHGPDAAWSGPVFAAQQNIDRDGKIMAVAYLAREGTDLPTF